MSATKGKQNQETSKTTGHESNAVLLSSSQLKTDSNQALTKNPEGFFHGLSKLYGDDFSFIEDIIRADITGLKRQLEEVFDYSKQREKEVDALIKSSRMILNSDFDESARSIFEICKHLLGATAGYLALLSEDDSESKVLFWDSGGFGCTVDRALPMPIRGLRENVYNTGKAVFQNDFDLSHWKNLLPAGHVKLRNVLFAPLNINNKTYGLLGLANKTDGFSVNDAVLASAFGELAAVALKNSKTLQNLSESREQLQTIMCAVKDAIIMVDNCAKIVYWNPAAEKMFGYHSDEAFGRDIHSLFVPNKSGDKRQNLLVDGMKVFATTSQGNFINGYAELLGQRPDGTTFPVETSISTVKLGTKWNAVVVVRDITERRSAEQKLIEAEKRYRTLFNQAPLGILLVDPKTTSLLEFNSVANQQLGYNPEEFSKLNIDDFEAVESVEEVAAHVKEMVASGGGEFETKHRTKDGLIRNVLVTTRTVELSGETYLNCIFHDITEIRKTQEALRRSEEQSKAIVANALIGIATSDINKRFMSANEAFCKILGYTEAEMRLLTFKDITHPDDLAESVSKMKALEAGDIASFVVEKRYIKKDGTVIDGKAMVSKICDQEGKTLLFIAELEDITEKKYLQKELSDYSKRLEELVYNRTRQLEETQKQLVKSERLAAIGELASMVGHDLRNPLSAIKNAAYLLKKKGLTSETEAKTMIEIIEDGISRSDKIINDLLEYARDMSLNRQQTPLGNLLKIAISTTQIPDNVTFVLCNEEINVMVDKNKMQRVFINMIKNSIDAMPNGGKITVDWCEDGDVAAVSFEDTGVGIAEDVLPKLFAPLCTTKAQGMGFGLAICKRIVEAHGGTIKVESSKDRGTVFLLTLPLAKN